jgi:hypothetical protein
MAKPDQTGISLWSRASRAPSSASRAPSILPRAPAMASGLTAEVLARLQSLKDALESNVITQEEADEYRGVVMRDAFSAPKVRVDSVHGGGGGGGGKKKQQ